MKHTSTLPNDSPRTASSLANDIKYAWRQLIRRPGHTVSVIACLVIGLVVSIGTFSAIESLFVGDQVGVHDRSTIARIYLSYDEATSTENVGGVRVAAEPLSTNDFTIMRTLRDGSVLESIGSEGVLTVTASAAHGPISVLGGFASGGFFKTLRTETVLGRVLDDGDDAPGAPPVAVITDYFWRTQLDGRADVIGQQILVGGRSFSVIGVTPERFHGMRSLDIGDAESSGVQVWLPLNEAASWASRPSADDPWLLAIGRMRPNVKLADVKQELSVSAARVAASTPALRAQATATVRPHGFGPNDAPLEILLIVLLVLMLPLTVLGIGCANVANLQLARAAERSRELAVRLSLGATRGQLVRLLTLETLARALVSVGLALIAIKVSMQYLQPFFPTALVIDWKVAAFATTLALGVALGTGLMPAWLVLRKTAAGQLKQSAQSGGLGHTRMRASLIIVQVALSLGLLTITALVMRTIRAMELAAPDMLREQVVATFNPIDLGMTPIQARSFADTLAARAAADGRITGVALSTSDTVRFAPPNVQGTGDQRTVTYQLAALAGTTPSWMRVMEARVLTGRLLNESDDTSVVVLSERAADIASPEGSPLGKMLTLQFGPGRSRTVQVVGVIADIPMRPTAARPDPVIYTAWTPTFEQSFTLRVRTKSTDAVTADLGKLITAIEPRMTWTSLRRGDRGFQDEASEMGMLVYAVGGCGLIALVLSATGLFAVMSYIVTLRRREIGVRVAIGADPRQIITLVMRQAIKLVAIGSSIGLLISVPLAFLMRATFVAKVDAADPLVYGPTLALLFVVGSIAAAVPALRASRVDPIATLRAD